ncbi:amino acid aminotransferase [Pararhodobacter sp. SW119]|uniref:amino acid aminotransferase n=1 Tax=Pararhodobacter sp. SW119 TaxID=2780075 RepID=UPI001ADECE79|nr:amino acid aminotransferase [Pararhodobacter sp. SW119]
MFQSLKTPAPDAILQVMQMFRDDPRADKVDLGVGVYRDDSGNTPVMRAVKAAEAHLLKTQDTKTYTALAGDPAYHAAMAALLLGDTVADDQIAAAATTGGTGAVRLVMELIRTARPDATVWISQPTWPNHTLLAKVVGVAQKGYRYYDAAEGALDHAGMMEDLQAAKPGDVVLLHGCCHNPTGADFTAQDWSAMADFLTERDLTPFVDIAYQGFGAGVEADAAGLRLLAERVPRVLIAASAAKNFGLYRDRAGIALVVCDAKERTAVQATLAGLNRASISFPPDHGARVVTTILDDPAMKADWLEELEEMRNRIAGLRRSLANALRRETGSDRFGQLAAQQGMFSVLGGSEAQIARLREEFGVYVVGGGRLNVAGLTEESVPRVARALAKALAD